MMLPQSSEVIINKSKQRVSQSIPRDKENIFITKSREHYTEVQSKEVYTKIH